MSVFEALDALPVSLPVPWDGSNVERVENLVNHISCGKKQPKHLVWSNFGDLTRPHPKWWFSKGNPLISRKSGLVKYYNLTRSGSRNYNALPWENCFAKWLIRVGFSDIYQRFVFWLKPRLYELSTCKLSIFEDVGA